MLSLNVFVLLIYLGFYLYIYKKHPALMVVFFYFFYGYLSMVVSVFYLDMGGVFVFELEKYSYHSNSLLFLEMFLSFHIFTLPFSIYIFLSGYIQK